ncbi:MAG: hypothetical protein IPK04_05910 [Bdellovibrionales bacterium]|nr:hypothetical protein [Bdellovibrionales bacterium]
MKSTFQIFLLVLALDGVFFFWSDRVWGAGTHPKFKVTGFQILRAGEIEKSFAEAGAGLGGEISLMTDGDIAAGFIKGRITSQSGSQKFLDGTTETTASFTYLQTGFDGGGLLFLIPRKNEGINIYIGLGGALSYNYLALDKTITFTTITNNSQAFGFGYAALMGVELFPTKNKWTVVAEFAYRIETASLVGQSQFSLGGLLASFGFGW